MYLKKSINIRKHTCAQRWNAVLYGHKSIKSGLSLTFLLFLRDCYFVLLPNVYYMLNFVYQLELYFCVRLSRLSPDLNYLGYRGQHRYGEFLFYLLKQNSWHMSKRRILNFIPIVHIEQFCTNYYSQLNSQVSIYICTQVITRGMITTLRKILA